MILDVLRLWLGSSAGKSADVGDGWAEPDICLGLCRRRPSGSLFTDSPFRMVFLCLANGLCVLPGIGNESPRNFPRLATPTPHVKVVLYPAQAFPPSRHGVQYGLFLSQLAFSLVHVKQSFSAPLAVVRLRFRRGVHDIAAVDTLGFATSSTNITVEMSAVATKLTSNFLNPNSHFVCN